MQNVLKRKEYAKYFVSFLHGYPIKSSQVRKKNVFALRGVGGGLRTLRNVLKLIGFFLPLYELLLLKLSILNCRLYPLKVEYRKNNTTLFR